MQQQLGRPTITTRTRNLLIIAGVIGLCAYTSWAEAAPQLNNSSQQAPNILRLTLDQVIASTLAYHPSLKGEYEERIAADAELLSSKGAFDPTIRGEALDYTTGGYTGAYGDAFVEQPLQDLYGSKAIAGYRKSSGSFPIYDNNYETNTGGEAMAGIEVPVLRDGPIDRRRTNINRALQEQNLANASIGLRRIDLARTAAAAFWEWTAARNRVFIYKNLVKVAEQRDAQITERVATGDLPQYDRIDNQRAVLQRQSQLVTAERAVKGAEYLLSLFFRATDGQPIDPTGYTAPERIPQPLVQPQGPVEAHISEALAARPEFNSIKAQRAQNTLELTLARNQILPRLDLRVFAAKDYGSGEQAREDTEVKTGIRFEIPLATRTQTGKIEMYEAKQRKLAFTETFLKERIRVDVQDALTALDAAFQRIAITDQEVKAAKELADGEAERFQAGDSNLIFVNLREQNAADAEIRQVDALLDYQRAMIAFEAILARSAAPSPLS